MKFTRNAPLMHKHAQQQVFSRANELLPTENVHECPAPCLQMLHNWRLFQLSGLAGDPIRLTFSKIQVPRTSSSRGPGTRQPKRLERSPVFEFIVYVKQFDLEDCDSKLPQHTQHASIGVLDYDLVTLSASELSKQKEVKCPIYYLISTVSAPWLIAEKTSDVL